MSFTRIIIKDTYVLCQEEICVLWYNCINKQKGDICTMKNYYEILKDLREDKDLDQEDIAKVLGIDKSYYGKYERGQHPLPIERLKTLCLFYGISADYILGLPENLPYP